MNMKVEDQVAHAVEELQADMQKPRGFFGRKRPYDDLDKEERDQLVNCISVFAEVLRNPSIDWKARERRVRLAIEPLLAFYEEDTS